MQNTNYSHRKSSQAGKVPAPELLRVGEIALNLADKKIFSKDEDGRVISFFDDNVTAENTFLMEDAADAKRIILGGTGLDPEGYLYNISADSNIDTAEILYSTGGNLWQLNVTDVNGKTFPTDLINGEKVDVEYDGVALGRFTISATANGSTLVDLDWTGLDVDPNTVNTVKFTPIAAVYKDFEVNEAWVHDGTNFVPKKVALKTDLPTGIAPDSWDNVGGGMTSFKMEDATDAAQNTVDLPNLSWDVGSSNLSGHMMFFGGVPAQMTFSKTDKNGVTVTRAMLENKRYNVSVDGGDPHTVVVITTDEDGLSVKATWENLSDNIPTTTFDFIGNATEPFKTGDTWVHDGTNFVPTPVVPTIVVTAFPLTPLPNTLYIKVEG